MAVARIEWRTETIGKLRVWNRDDQTYGDPFAHGLWVEVIGDRFIEISLLDKKVKRSHWIAIIKMCKRDGIRRILAKRFRKRVEQDHIIEVK